MKKIISLYLPILCFSLASCFHKDVEKVSFTQLNCPISINFSPKNQGTYKAQYTLTGNLTHSIHLNIKGHSTQVTHHQFNIRKGIIDTTITTDWYDQAMELEIVPTLADSEAHLDLEVLFYSL